MKSLQNELFVKLEEEQEAKQSAARPTSRNLDGAGTKSLKLYEGHVQLL